MRTRCGKRRFIPEFWLPIAEIEFLNFSRKNVVFRNGKGRNRVFLNDYFSLRKNFDLPHIFLSMRPLRKEVAVFLDSSAVEQPAVNRWVTGSNPVRGAIDNEKRATLTDDAFCIIDTDARRTGFETAGTRPSACREVGRKPTKRLPMPRRFPKRASGIAGATLRKKNPIRGAIHDFQHDIR
ncbi:MAG: hypothetical protein QG650_990 [Patescibacteria group bacterium]|nr:hypothetical protein [Patescibacteria group bacterium]